MHRFSTKLRVIVVLAAVLCLGNALAADTDIPLDSDGLPAWQVKEWTDFPVRITLRDLAELEVLLAQVPVASFDRSQIRPDVADGKPWQLVFTPRVTDDEFAALQLAGYRPERLRDLDREHREATEKLWGEMAAGKAADVRNYPLNYVPTNDQTGTMLQDLAAAHPTMAHYYSWGSSIQGRTLHAIKITQDVQTSAPKPQVRYSATIHGDEITGLVLTLNLAHFLMDKYGQSGYEHVTDLVDNYELHLMPNHNPDGTFLVRRTNANNVDLNRNFPLPAGTHPITQHENLLFMAHAQAHHFVISLNYHGGALVMNYPWDYTYTLAPDNDALIKLSLEYSTRNLPMYNGSFPQGITNGAAWYVITGSLQDWSYDQTDCIDVTCEVSNVKWPSNAALPGFWNDNRESMIAYARSARAGITGRVTDAASGAPLAATITITGNAMPVHTNPAHGDYYKLLDTGTYQVTAEAIGYVTQTISGVANVWGVENVVDFAMQPLAGGHVAGTVTNQQGQGLDATVTITTWPAGAPVETVTTSAASGGAYEVDLFQGDYTFTVSAEGYMTTIEQVTVGNDPVALDFVLGGAVISYPIAEDFEAGTGVFSGQWVQVGPGFGSGYCLKSSTGNYPHNASLITGTTTGVSLENVSDPEVSFMAKWAIEASWDAVFFEVSTNGGSQWTALAVPGRTRSASGQGVQVPVGTPCFDGTQANWVTCAVDLTPYIGQTDVRFRFRLASDSSVSADGFYVDDFLLRITTSSGDTTPVDLVPTVVASVAAYPNPFNPSTTVRFTNPRDGAVEVAIYDLQGRLVRSLLSADLAMGHHDVAWDGLTDRGTPAGSGVYFVRMNAGRATAGAKVSLVK